MGQITMVEIQNFLTIFFLIFTNSYVPSKKFIVLFTFSKINWKRCRDIVSFKLNKKKKIVFRSIFHMILNLQIVIEQHLPPHVNEIDINVVFTVIVSLHCDRCLMLHSVPDEDHCWRFKLVAFSDKGVFILRSIFYQLTQVMKQMVNCDQHYPIKSFLIRGTNWNVITE